MADFGNMLSTGLQGAEQFGSNLVGDVGTAMSGGGFGQFSNLFGGATPAAAGAAGSGSFAPPIADLGTSGPTLSAASAGGSLPNADWGATGGGMSDPLTQALGINNSQVGGLSSTLPDPTFGQGHNVTGALPAGGGVNMPFAPGETLPTAGMTGGAHGGLGGLMPLGLLAYSVLGNRQPGETKQLASLAQQQRDLAGSLTPAAIMELQTGKLPPGAQAGIDQAKNAAMAAIRSKYAGMGMAGSTAEAQDLASAEENSIALQFEMASKLAGEGLSAAQAGTNSASQLYEAILQSETARGSAMGQALANFASAMAYGQARGGG